MARSKTGSPAKENPPAAAERVSPSTNGPSPKAWTPILNRYRQQSWIRSIVELAITAGLLALFWTVMLASLKVGYWLTLLLAVPTAGFMVRIFILQHDCGHGSSFRRRATNDWVGRILGVFTLTPYDVWRREHAIHHASAGNLGRRGIGDVKTITSTSVEGYSSFDVLGRHARIDRIHDDHRNDDLGRRLGPSYENRVVIDEGLAVGDQLVTLGHRLVDHGSLVRVVNAAGDSQ